MKHLLLLAISLGLVPSLKGSLKSPIHVPIYQVGVKLTKTQKSKILKEINRFPKVRGRVKGILVAKNLQVRLRNGKTVRVLGAYDGTMIYLKYSVNMIKILRHEIGHALARNLTAKQRAAWVKLFKKKLKALNYKAPPKKWWNVLNHDGFPSPYSMSKLGEFIAEHIMFASTYPTQHAIIFKEAHLLLKKHGMLPEN